MKTLALILVLAALPALGQTPSYTTGSTSGPLLTTGQNDIGIGNFAAPDMRDGSYNFCIGDWSCKGVISQNCVIDIKEPVKWPYAFNSQADVDSAHEFLSRSLVIIDQQGKECGADIRRILALLELTALVPWGEFRSTPEATESRASTALYHWAMKVNGVNAP